jgi:two-component system CheB/CheR fusion protein
MAEIKPAAKAPGEIINPEPVEPQSAAFPIVGVGASAGGLAAFEAFFSAMPDDTPGMAFVLVQHLARGNVWLLEGY